MYLAHKVKSGFTPVFQNDLCAKSFEQRFESSKGEFIMDKRISKDEYYLSIAAAVARRSTCLRRQYGAVIIKNDEIISTGYNGAARGEPNCCDTGECWREANNIPHGEQYEKCVAVHAEQNAIISAARHEMLGSVLYLAGFDSNGEPTDKKCRHCRGRFPRCERGTRAHAIQSIQLIILPVMLVFA